MGVVCGQQQLLLRQQQPDGSRVEGASPQQDLGKKQQHLGTRSAGSFTGQQWPWGEVIDRVAFFTGRVRSQGVCAHGRKA